MLNINYGNHNCKWSLFSAKGHRNQFIQRIFKCKRSKFHREQSHHKITSMLVSPCTAWNGVCTSVFVCGGDTSASHLIKYQEDLILFFKNIKALRFLNRCKS